MRYKWIVIVCLVLFAQHGFAQGDVCKYSRALYYDDFGGNDPIDPWYYIGANPNIVDYTNSNGAETQEGQYTITKKGLQKILTLDNGYKGNYWFQIGDHTHPEENRGYFLEVNGYLSESVVYRTTIENVNVHPGQKLVFSAYVTDIVCTACLNDIADHMGCSNCGLCIPSAVDLEFRLYDAAKNQRIRFFQDRVWTNTEWQPIEHAVTMYQDVSSVRLEIALKGRQNCIVGDSYGNDFAIDDIQLRVCGPEYVAHDTTVCDTLFPFSWRGHEFIYSGTRIDTIRDVDLDDSVYVYNTIKDTNCYRHYSIIVNKYNWQLLCDNIALRNLFPQSTPETFQWYKDGKPVDGANMDNYSEQDELHGSYQLCIGMSNGTLVWSNIIDVLDTRVPSPVRVQIYDSRGVPVREDQVRHGIYLYRYEQDDHVWTEKKLIP